MWLSYADETSLFEVDFNKDPLGHVSDKPTTVGTKLPEPRGLQSLKGEAKGCGKIIPSSSPHGPRDWLMPLPLRYGSGRCTRCSA